MRLTYSIQQEAQAVADRIFADMAGKLEPGTTAWAKAYQDLGKDGKPLDTLWHIAVDERVRAVVTKTEADKIPEWKVVTK